MGAGGPVALRIGPPGSGKTTLARRLPGILPPLTLTESISVTKVHSLVAEEPPSRLRLSLHASIHRALPSPHLGSPPRSHRHARRSTLRHPERIVRRAFGIQLHGCRTRSRDLQEFLLLRRGFHWINEVPQLKIPVLEDQWMLIPVLSAGTAVESATVGGGEVQLLSSPTGLAWSTRKSGAYDMILTYRVDASRSDAGLSLVVPLPQAASTGVVLAREKIDQSRQPPRNPSHLSKATTVSG